MPRRPRPFELKRYLPFAPSIALGFVGAGFLLLWPLELEAQATPIFIVLAGLGLALALLSGAWLLERLLPSFRYASRLLENALASTHISLGGAFVLAILTSVAEEVFFRGALLSLIGVWGQALVFGLMHPAPLRGWSYTAYTFCAGVAFGYLTIYTGSLWAPILAHFLVNLYGFLEARRIYLQRAESAEKRVAELAAEIEEASSTGGGGG